MRRSATHSRFATRPSQGARVTAYDHASPVPVAAVDAHHSLLEPGLHHGDFRKLSHQIADESVQIQERRRLGRPVSSVCRRLKLLRRPLVNCHRCDSWLMLDDRPLDALIDRSAGVVRIDLLAPHARKLRLGGQSTHSSSGANFLTHSLGSSRLGFRNQRACCGLP
jgi:hypothetical protein